MNWGLYISEDWQNAQHTLRHGGSLLQWTSAFGTSLDEAAWFGLLFLWELETYALSENAYGRYLKWLFLGIRGVCYAFIAHTVFAWSTAAVDLAAVNADPQLSDLCTLAGEEVSWTRNLHYTLIEPHNCAQLSTQPPYYFVDSTAVTDAEGLRLERRLAWVDLQDAITWLLVMLSIEIAIWLQERDITGGPLMIASHAAKVLYGLLLVHAAFWAWHGHWLYCWDQVLWIGGFIAIEMNVRDWREEIEEEEDAGQPGDQRSAAA